MKTVTGLGEDLLNLFGINYKDLHTLQDEIDLKDALNRSPDTESTDSLLRNIKVESPFSDSTKYCRCCNDVNDIKQ